MNYYIPDNLGCVLEFTLMPLEKIVLSDMPTQTLRGAFGTVLKDKLCVNKSKDCSKCIIRHGCVYSVTFETPQQSIPTRYKGLDAPPRPYIFYMPDRDKTNYSPGEKMRFHMTLIGRSTQWIQYFIFAFLKLSERGLGKSRGKFHLQTVREINPFRKSALKLFDSNKQLLVAQPKGVTATQVYATTAKHKEATSLTLHFDTPARIKRNGVILEQIDFDSLLRHLVRRQAQLFYFYHDYELPLDFNAYFKDAINIRKSFDKMEPMEKYRFSGRQKINIRMGGPQGTVTFEGSNLADFLHPLLLGQLFHVGKGATFGLGHYTITMGD